MTRQWYAIYVDGELSPSSLFADLKDAKAFSYGKKVVIRSIAVDSDIVKKTFLITAFADFNPTSSNT